MKCLKLFLSLDLLALSLLAVPAFGATLCVTASSSPGCYTRISDAVAAAAPNDVIQVGAGTFRESVVLSKPLSLVGSGNSTIDATGFSWGVFVNGMSTTGLAAVHVSGFTIQNASLEGVLVANASDVTIASNSVLNNNQALVAGNCTMLPSFEPGEAQDCGEGIHLMGVNHSIVTNNIVQGNSGGILLSDDTGQTFFNLVSYNTVTDNPFACGITMASHVPAAITGSATPLGVFHNTIFGNRSKHNGYSVGGGAGIGIFASVPGAESFANVVVDNFVSENGHPGISMHAHAPGQSLNDNMIIGNTVVNNGADTADATTPGPTGINVYSVVPSSGNMIVGNSIQSEAYDVALKIPAMVQVQFNSLNGNQVGVANLGVGPVDATENWWGCPSGPPMPGSCSAASGMSLQSLPSLSAPPPPQPSY